MCIYDYLKGSYVFLYIFVNFNLPNQINRQEFMFLSSDIKTIKHDIRPPWQVFYIFIIFSIWWQNEESLLLLTYFLKVV